MNQNKTALCLGAHPDDAEFSCGGTLALLRQKGWDIHIATMAPGDCGTTEYSREEISRIRKAEAAKSVAMLDGQYHCLEEGDIFIMYDRPTLLKAIELVRRVKPSIVFTLCPEDYMIDHTTTSKLAMTACFCCGVPNIKIEGVGTYEPVPSLFYMDPVSCIDIFGNEILPGMVVNITDVYEKKREMLACHESQRNWLLQHHGMDEYLDSMQKTSARRGTLIKSPYGEGFRQHLGDPFPQDNILKTELGDLLYKL